MNEQEFEKQLNALHDRVLSKALSDEEKNNYTESLFESIRHVNKYGQEFWYARDLQICSGIYWVEKLLQGLLKRQKKPAEVVITRYLTILLTSTKIVNAGATSKDIGDIQLSRYACYLIVQRWSSKKDYCTWTNLLSVKTRQQELIENYENLSEDQKRIAIRQEMKEHNKMLVAAAKDAGVETTLDYAIFQNYGYMGLYGGLKASDIKERKGLKKSQDILDYMGYEELAANLFRATQTEAKLRRENIQGKQEANKTHFEVGKKVRDTIKDLGGTMPEDLPTPEKSIQQLEREQKKKLK